MRYRMYSEFARESAGVGNRFHGHAWLRRLSAAASTLVFALSILGVAGAFFVVPGTLWHVLRNTASPRHSVSVSLGFTLLAGFFLWIQTRRMREDFRRHLICLEFAAACFGTLLLLLFIWSTEWTNLHP